MLSIQTSSTWLLVSLNGMMYSCLGVLWDACFNSGCLFLLTRWTHVRGEFFLREPHGF